MLLVCSLLLVFSLAYALFYFYFRFNGKKPWNLRIENGFQPSVSIMVPTHNEEGNIERKLANLQTVNYPKDKMEVIIVDDASEDKTLLKVDEVISRGLEFKTKVVRQKSRGGKAVALNTALDVVSSSIVIVTDADTLWPSNILEKALPFLADPTVGAVTGRGINEQTSESWVTKAEDNYLELTSSIRLGESKVHSTLRFEGGFCAYKRDAFDKFDCESGSDDSGTALKVIQHNLRTILVPDAVFYTSFPTSLSGKLKVKVRRANQLISLWIKCLKFMLERKLVLPKRIVMPEVFMFIINPFVFAALAVASVGYVFLFPLSILSLFLLACILGLLIFARNLFLEFVVDNLLLVYASVSYLFGRRYVAWKRA
jgi:cellulose synthase/poly-beta-1,6-N-acetylglucosamine synthase-like glycosyltransferase